MESSRSGMRRRLFHHSLEVEGTVVGGERKLPVIPHFCLVVMTFPTLVSSLVFFLALSPLQALAKANYSEPCDTINTKLQVGTFELSGDCVAQAYCDETSKTCLKKTCRREEFPPHYPQGSDDDWPPMCGEGQFCPDEGSGCQPLLKEGDNCQLNRDDMCEPPPDGEALNDPPYNTNGSVCINFKCRYANVAEGGTCETEQIPYIAYSDDEEFAFVVSRGNCLKGLFCDAQQKTCIKKKDKGAQCTADKECVSDNCDIGNTCGDYVFAAAVFPMWVYIVVGVGIIAGIVLTMVALYFIHRRGRDDEYEKRTQYWREQTAMRQNILQMKETAPCDERIWIQSCRR
ncbi:hypothetical protein BKA62DRAFT_400426 [Auriculariales sp. MPI-PUGE-AT-0066]|nr:hypothetical protein BKA62DRAFT_400426 [Auriculariales sp. MPI-PUGE-AT-0066]